MESYEIVVTCARYRRTTIRGYPYQVYSLLIKGTEFRLDILPRINNVCKNTKVPDQNLDREIDLEAHYR